MKKWLISLTLLVLVVAGVAYWQRIPLQNWWQEQQAEPLPQAESFSDIENADTNATTNTNNNSTTNNSNSEAIEDTPKEPEEMPEEEIIIPESINLDIPFTSQAPNANWDLPYQEACEEASSIMAARFLQGRGIQDANDADQAILELVDYETNTLHYPIDMNAEQTAHMIKEYYSLDTELVYDFTWDDVKRALAQGYPVLLPAAGQQLGNPNYTAPGPVYHMLVLKGYTTSKVITNDSGTRNGANYQYTYDKLYNAAHDWNNGDVINGKKVIIIVKPQS